MPGFFHLGDHRLHRGRRRAHRTADVSDDRASDPDRLRVQQAPGRPGKSGIGSEILQKQHGGFEDCPDIRRHGHDRGLLRDKDHLPAPGGHDPEGHHHRTSGHCTHHGAQKIQCQGRDHEERDLKKDRRPGADRRRDHGFLQQPVRPRHRNRGDHRLHDDHALRFQGRLRKRKGADRVDQCGGPCQLCENRKCGL